MGFRLRLRRNGGGRFMTPDPYKASVGPAYPANPTTASYYTYYTYDALNHLTGVNMPRPTGTQTRTFNYGTPPGAYLLSTTNPENGTVTYTYTWFGKLATKTDAKNQ